MLHAFLPHTNLASGWIQLDSDIGGRTYLNLIDKVHLIEQQGYEIDIQDNRKEYNFVFDKAYKDYLSDIKWPQNIHTKDKSLS